MFIAIEGDYAMERFSEIVTNRTKLADYLWNVSSSDVFVLNRTQYEEM